MICIEEHILQKYIDGECTEIERKAVSEHLSDCPVCARKQAERQGLSAGIKQAVNSLTIEVIEIPAFRNRMRIAQGKNYKLMIYSLSAACILLFILFFVDKNMDAQQKKTTIVQSVPREVDANRPASDQEFVIKVYDGRGHVSEFFID